MNTKKLLVAYDESKPTAGNGDFLALIFEGSIPTFFGLRSHCTCKSGRMVFIGKEIAAKDIFAKLVESGQKFESVDRALETLIAYVEHLEGFKIGNVVTIAPKSGDPGFELIKVAEIPKSDTRMLP